jgi:arylsulfatase A-like enzyme
MRCLFVFVCLLAVAASASAGEPKRTEHTRPNVLFIAVDDLNDWIGCLGGHPQTRTPNLDALARSGVLFTNAYVAAPACGPSRAAILSGRLPGRTGLYENLQKLREVMPDAVLLPRYFSDHGYWSAGSGKILHYVIDPPSWDDYYPPKATDDPFPPTFYPEKRPVSLPVGGDWQYKETDWAALDVTDEEFGGDWLVSTWVGEQFRKSHDKPFFLACGIYRPHEPWFVPKKYFEPFPIDTIQPGPGYRDDDLDDVPPAAKRLARNRYFPHIQAHGHWKNGIQAYLASIHFSDAMVGRVLDALDKSPCRDNTIVVLWSDHGWHLGEKEHWQKFTGWRLCDRVPLMIRVPAGIAPGLMEGTTPGSVCERVVSLADLYHTLIDLCGLPDKAGIDGRSLVPLLRNPALAWSHAAITHLSEPESFAISTERWRYIHYQGGDEELYDIQADPHEWTNLAGNPDHAAALAEARAASPKDAAPKFEAQPGVNAIKTDRVLPLVPVGKAECPKSEDSNTEVAIVFQNQRQAAVQVVWVDQSGIRHPRRQVPGASRRFEKTYAGHAWEIIDENGKAIGHVVADDEPARVIIH